MDWVYLLTFLLAVVGSALGSLWTTYILDKYEPRTARRLIGAVIGLEFVALLCLISDKLL